MNTTLTEPERSTPIVGDYDVVVAGGGPAGIAAALAAGRAGARVALLDVAGCLGGTWTAGLVCWVIDGANKGGIIAELGDELDARGARAFRVPGGKNWAFDPEQMKLLLDERCAETSVTVQFHTRVVGAQSESGRLSHLLTESKSGRQAWAGRVFIDCTGDGDLAAHAGCSFDVGHPETGRVQPMSFPLLVTGLRWEEAEPFTGGALHEPKHRLLAACQEAGFDPSYHPPVLLRVYDDLYILIGDHQYNVDSRDAAAVSAATAAARVEVNGLVKALRASGGVWRDMRILATPEHIGVREGRRIHGRATVTIDDMMSGRHPADSIATCAFGFDVHSTESRESWGFQQPEGRPKPYGLPLGALIARDTDALLMAGRCVSGDFFAHSSYRVTGDAAAMGQAAGTCAAMAVQQACLPQNVDAEAVREQLRATGCAVPGQETGTSLRRTLP